MTRASAPVPATCTILFLFTTLVGGAAAQATADPAACAADPAELRAAVQDVHDRQRNVGVAAAIAVDGRLAFETYLGMADLEHEVPVGPETRFGVASVTKLVTAAALLAQVEAGSLALEDPVQRHVPGFPEREEGPITLEILATHRSGIPHPSERTPALFATRYATATDAIEVYRDVPLAHAPGERRTYSSSNYNLIAAAIEGATGRTFRDVVSTSILEPLGMDATAFDDVLAVQPHRARRYSFYHPWTYAESETLYRVPSWDYSFNPGGGLLTSTARDLVAFGSALIEGRVLPSNGLERLGDPAWFGRTTESGERYLFASGANPGVQASLAVNPDRRTTAAVLSNTWGLGSRSGEMADLSIDLVEACGTPDRDLSTSSGSDR